MRAWRHCELACLALRVRLVASWRTVEWPSGTRTTSYVEPSLDVFEANPEMAISEKDRVLAVDLHVSSELRMCTAELS